MGRLYLIQEELRLAIAEAIDPDTGEILSEDAEKRLDDVLRRLDGAALDLVAEIKNEIALADMAKEEAGKLRDRAKSHERVAEYLKLTLEEVVPQGDTLEDGRGKLSWRKSPDSVEITDPSELPEELQRVTVTMAPDKKAIMDRLKAGEIVPGATKKIGSRHIVIS